MKLFLLLLPLLAAGQTSAPTIPTPFPTQTPAPKSVCDFQGADEGPFPLDCLQMLFVEEGCSPRGDSYPTNTKLQATAAGADKAWYNERTWAQVEAGVTAIVAAGGLECAGIITNQPTAPPTLAPTTLAPTPQPTLPPTTTTPAPTFGEAALWDKLGSVLASDTGADATLAAECVAKGYNREYDASQYIVKVVMDGYTDYYKTDSTTEICDMIADPINNPVYWSTRVNGPWALVTVDPLDASQFTVMMTDNGPDHRRYPSWVAATGGFGSTNPAGGDNAGTAGKAFTMGITTERQNEPCRERMSPLMTNTFDSPAFNSPCMSTGDSGQVWDETAPFCDGSTGASQMEWRYAVGNRQFGTCDSLCVWSMDYVHASSPLQGTYWFWNAAAGFNCWKSVSDYLPNEFHYCRTDHNLFNQSGEDQQQFDWALVEKALLCQERCDMANGWVYASGSCYRVATNAEYMNEAVSGNQNKGVAYCNSVLDTGNAVLASVGSESENMIANTLCAVTNECYFGGMTGMGNGSGTFADGSQITWTNWARDEMTERAQGATMSGVADGGQLAMLNDGTWTFYGNGRHIGVLCETASMYNDAQGMLMAEAEDCALATATAQDELVNTKSFPDLDVAASGFTDANDPGMLHIVVNVPNTMYDIDISFENSTNDIADYNWAWTNTMWTFQDAPNCGDDYVLTGEIPWAVFNLGGAGGVERLATWEDNTATTAVGGNVRNTQDELVADGSHVYYQFGSTVRIEAKQPIFTSIEDHLGASRLKREARMDRQVVVRVPFVLRFQKTITVTTDVNIVSTKYNYKTVAAIIQSIQHSTQYFTPPYAKIQMQIRTKSQYPYLFNKDATQANLHVASVDSNPNTPGVPGVPVQLSLEWLHDDVNCTFTNSDHMREGDICTQEWLLHITPEDNVCYATGEYSIELLTDCFYGKDVCYRPVDEAGAPIPTVTFTFKVQTSKFCPELADEVDLTGSMVVTGRESFKPLVEGKEGATPGQFYMQGETIHVLATTDSQKAKIVDTKIAMVELVQDFGGLVQTGYNRVPYDMTFADKTIWMRNPSGNDSPQFNRVATGTVTVDDGQSVTSGVVLMTDAMVVGTGDDPCTAASCVFGPKEAGFKFNLHSRAMPVNVDSFGSKTLIATLEVTYEALDGSNGQDVNTIGRRRRLLNRSPSFDMRSSVSFPMRSWAPESLPKGLGETASMALEITLSSKVDRSNVLSFSQAVHTAIVQSINADNSGKGTVYDDQVAIDQILSDGVSIWTRPRQGQLDSRRRLANVAQRLTIEFTFANQDGGMALTDMISSFDRQLRNPASPLMNQPLFSGSVVHSVKEIQVSDYAVTTSKLASSAFVAVPSLFALLALLW